MKKKKEKNSNLSKYREKLAGINKALVERAIKHIVDLSGEITFSTVSTVTYEIADPQKGEKGLTLAAISKSAIYRTMVEEARANQDQKKVVPKSLKHYSQGDLGLMLHALRVENAGLKQENKTLALKLKEAPETIETIESIPDEIIKKAHALQSIARGIVNRLCELELTFIDSKTNTLMLAHYGEVIVHEEALKLFYKKEIDEIQSKIRENATEGEFWL